MKIANRKDMHDVLKTTIINRLWIDLLIEVKEHSKYLDLNEVNNAFKRVNFLNIKEISYDYGNNCFIITISFISGNRQEIIIHELEQMTHNEYIARKSGVSIYNKLTN